MIARAPDPRHELAAYGHGDWNDSLQPADPAMRERLCSAWTVTLHVPDAGTLAAALRRVGRGARAPALEALAAQMRADFQRLLLADGVLAGFACFHPMAASSTCCTRAIARPGIHYRLLPMIHAIINELLTPAQARAHVALIRQHLLAPDGARLFDRPPAYRGGPQRLFQRAETSTFFGREIGLMYMHAHLRYAEAMAHWATPTRSSSRSARRCRSACATWCRPRGCARQLLHVELRRGLRRSLPGGGALRRARARRGSRSRAAGASTRAAPASRSG